MENNNYQYHIYSPYRVCPLGAHVDHQHGLVTGFAINKGVDLWFNVREDSLVKLTSLSFEGEVEFDLAKRSEVTEKNASPPSWPSSFPSSATAQNAPPLTLPR